MDRLSMWIGSLSSNNSRRCIRISAYLIICSVMMAIVNENMGKTDVNLASKFLGISEISASLRDSGALQLLLVQITSNIHE